jgi:hypothetical protein
LLLSETEGDQKDFEKMAHEWKIAPVRDFVWNKIGLNLMQRYGEQKLWERGQEIADLLSRYHLSAKEEIYQVASFFYSIGQFEKAWNMIPEDLRHATESRLPASTRTSFDTMLQELRKKVHAQ